MLEKKSHELGKWFWRLRDAFELSLMGLQKSFMCSGTHQPLWSFLLGSPKSSPKWCSPSEEVGGDMDLVSLGKICVGWLCPAAVIGSAKDFCLVCSYVRPTRSPVLSAFLCFQELGLSSGWFTEGGKWPNPLETSSILHWDKRGNKNPWKGEKLLQHLSNSFLPRASFIPFVTFFWGVVSNLCSPYLFLTFLFLHKLFHAFHLILEFSVSFSNQNTFCLHWHLAAVISVDYFVSV